MGVEYLFFEDIKLSFFNQYKSHVFYRLVKLEIKIKRKISFYSTAKIYQFNKCFETGHHEDNFLLVYIYEGDNKYHFIIKKSCI